MIGKSLGNYRIVDQIGLGGMATVYKAFDAGMDRYVALKVLPEYHAKDPTFKQRFQREAKAIAHLEHMNILPVYGYGEEDDIAYLVMRYMPTGTLADLISQGPVDLAECSRLLMQIAGALDYAHQNDILHRDVKPSNILIDAHGNAFLTDFGIARMLEGISDLTGSGIIGTPQYMSPEQCQGRRDLVPASDQYSLGVVLYEMLTGRKPFHAETPMAVIMMHLHDPLPPPRLIRPELPDEAEQVILKAMAKQPGDRFPSCSAMAAAFAKAVERAGSFTESADTLQIASPGASMPTQGRPPAAATMAPRHARGWIWGAVALLLILAIGAAAMTLKMLPAASTSVTLTPASLATDRLATLPSPTGPGSAGTPAIPTLAVTSIGAPTPIGGSNGASIDPTVIDAFGGPILAAIQNSSPAFEDDFSVARAGWDIQGSLAQGGFAPSVVEGKVQDGSLNLSTTTGGVEVYISHPDISVNDNVVFEGVILVKSIASEQQPNGPTFMWRYDEKSGGSFQFIITWDLGGWRMVKRGFNDPAGDQELVNRFQEISNPLHIQVIALGTRHAVYLNGKPAVYFEDSEYLHGKVAFYFGFSGDPDPEKGERLRFSFDEVRLWNLDDVPGLAGTP